MKRFVAQLALQVALGDVHSTGRTTWLDLVFFLFELRGQIEELVL